MSCELAYLFEQTLPGEIKYDLWNIIAMFKGSAVPVPVYNMFVQTYDSEAKITYSFAGNRNKHNMLALIIYHIISDPMTRTGTVIGNLKSHYCLPNKTLCWAGKKLQQRLHRANCLKAFNDINETTVRFKKNDRRYVCGIAWLCHIIFFQKMKIEKKNKKEKNRTLLKLVHDLYLFSSIFFSIYWQKVISDVYFPAFKLSVQRSSIL